MLPKESKIDLGDKVKIISQSEGRIEYSDNSTQTHEHYRNLARIQAEHAIETSCFILEMEKEGNWKLYNQAENSSRWHEVPLGPVAELIMRYIRI